MIDVIRGLGRKRTNKLYNPSNDKRLTGLTFYCSRFILLYNSTMEETVYFSSKQLSFVFALQHTCTGGYESHHASLLLTSQ